MRRISSAWLIAILAILLPVIVLYSMTVGTVSISMAEAFSAAVDRLFSSTDSNGQTQVILFDIRLPRILLALLVGAILASTGAVMQGLFRNPLADPSLIGVSGGASVGASLMIVLAGGAVESGLLMGLSLVALGAFVSGFAASATFATVGDTVPVALPFFAPCKW